MKEKLGSLLFYLLLAALLILCAELQGQPALRVVHGREMYPGLSGLTGVAPMSFSTNTLESGITIASLGGAITNALVFRVQIANVGLSPWRPPSNFVYRSSIDGTVVVPALLQFQLLDAHTNAVLSSRITGAIHWTWDAVNVTPGFPSYFGPSSPGISPGWAATCAFEPYTSWCVLPVRGDEGDCVLRVRLNPLGFYPGITNAVEVPLTIDVTNVRFRE